MILATVRKLLWIDVSYHRYGKLKLAVQTHIMNLDAPFHNVVPATVLIKAADYADFPVRYADACRRTLGPEPDFRELGIGKLVRAWDTLTYARQRGPGPVLQVLK